MSEVPGDLLYRDSHEWVRNEGDGTVVVGISDHAQAALGDMVFIELPEVGATYGQGDACAVIESVKAASDVYAPVSGKIVEVNESLSDAPETVNQDAYGEGWLFRMQPGDAAELDALMDADAYQAFLESESH